MARTVFGYYHADAVRALINVFRRNNQRSMPMAPKPPAVRYVKARNLNLGDVIERPGGSTVKVRWLKLVGPNTIEINNAYRFQLDAEMRLVDSPPEPMNQCDSGTWNPNAGQTAATYHSLRRPLKVLHEPATGEDYVLVPVSKDRCLPKVDVDEPIFVLRAQDVTSVQTIMHWLQTNRSTLPDEKHEATNRDIHRFIEWQRTHPDRVKRPD